MFLGSRWFCGIRVGLYSFLEEHWHVNFTLDNVFLIVHMFTFIETCQPVYFIKVQLNCHYVNNDLDEGDILSTLEKHF